MPRRSGSATKVQTAIAIVTTVVSELADSNDIPTRRQERSPPVLTMADNAVAEKDIAAGENVPGIATAASGTAATHRKMNVLTSECRGAESSSTIAYTIVDLDINSLLLERSSCRLCRGQLTIKLDAPIAGKLAQDGAHN
ncbi:hypothetical protein HPB52_024068 [Rhipicephalus sanguineus]|uniref:Uncharacterized protein n=1 Tax=Rhipicephalus sanguineus TaxID=34632 RepID=A0A9D4Q905_RHISA|nr:hypothetical protein HPB52_024068 [Rhipicephalus sanguineus]